MAAATQFNRIMADTRLRLPGAIDETMKYELYSVMDEFFRRTMIWQESILVGVSAGKRTYELDSNEWVATIHYLLWVQNKDLISVNASMQEAGSLYLYHAPEEPQIYTVRVALALADALDDDGFPQVPPWILVQYHEAFKDGLIAHMAMQPSKPYYNEKVALYHGSRFRSAMNEAFDNMKKQNLFDARAWVYPREFATSRRQ